jgi:type II secretory pathway pseudopilin PulG
MMVVVSIIIVLVAMVVPTIGPAMKKGAVHDAASAIQRASSMARQLARSSTEPRATGSGTAVDHYGVAVVVPSESEGNKPAYAVVVYGKVPVTYSFANNPDNQYPNGTPKNDGSGTNYGGLKPAGKFAFSRNVKPVEARTATATTVPNYTFMAAGSAVGWYYQYRTGFVFQDPSTATTAIDVGVPPVGATPTGTPQAFGVASLDMKYVVAVAIYKIGLLNAQDVN